MTYLDMLNHCVRIIIMKTILTISKKGVNLLSKKKFNIYTNIVLHFFNNWTSPNLSVFLIFSICV